MALPLRNPHSQSSSSKAALTAVAVARVDAIQRFQHDDGVAANHAHAQAHFLVVRSALGSLVQDDVQEDVVAAQRAHDFARAVQLHFDALIEVLFSGRDMSVIGDFEENLNRRGYGLEWISKVAFVPS